MLSTPTYPEAAALHAGPPTRCTCGCSPSATTSSPGTSPTSPAGREGLCTRRPAPPCCGGSAQGGSACCCCMSVARHSTARGEKERRGYWAVAVPSKAGRARSPTEVQLGLGRGQAEAQWGLSPQGHHASPHPGVAALSCVYAVPPSLSGREVPPAAPMGVELGALFPHRRKQPPRAGPGWGSSPPPHTNRPRALALAGQTGN